MSGENEPTAASRGAATKEEVALELMRFIASTTGIGKAGASAGFGGKTPKSAEEQVEVLLLLYEKCRAAVNK